MALNFAQAIAPKFAAPIVASNETKPKAQVWLNFGTVAPIPNQEGALEDTFVSPCGAPLDSLEPIQISANAKPSWRAMAEAKNAMLSELQREAETLAPGESRIYGTAPFMWELKRIAGQAAPLPAGQNPALAAVTGMFRMAAPATAAE